MVDCSSSKRSVSIRFRLAIELVILKGKVFPCRGKWCRIEAGLTRKGKVTIGKVRYLLNIVFTTLRCSNHLFSVVTPLFKKINIIIIKVTKMIVKKITNNKNNYLKINRMKKYKTFKYDLCFIYGRWQSWIQKNIL